MRQGLTRAVAVVVLWLAGGGSSPLLALSLVQDSDLVAAVGSPLTATLALPAPLDAGDLIVVFVRGSTSRTYAAALTTTGAAGWVSLATAPGLAILARANHPGGFAVVTVSHGGGSGSFEATARVFRPDADRRAIAVEAAGSVEETVDGLLHTASADPLQASRPVLALMVGRLNSYSGVQAMVPGPGYTRVPAAAAPSDRLFAQSQLLEAAVDEVGRWSHTGTPRRATGALALVSFHAAPPPPPPPPGTATQEILVGPCTAVADYREDPQPGPDGPVFPLPADAFRFYVDGVLVEVAGREAWNGTEIRLPCMFSAPGSYTVVMATVAGEMEARSAPLLVRVLSEGGPPFTPRPVLRIEMR